MKSFTYAYAIGTSHIDKKVNVFKIKDLEKEMPYNGIQSQRDEMASSGTF